MKSFSFRAPVALAVLAAGAAAPALAQGTSTINLNANVPLVCSINPSSQDLAIGNAVNSTVSATLTFRCNDYDGAKFSMFSQNGGLVNSDIPSTITSRRLAYSAELQNGTLQDIAIAATASTAMIGAANAVHKTSVNNSLLASSTGGTGTVRFVVTEPATTARWAGDYRDTLTVKLDAVP